mgnify:CR=1 FL=1
MLRYKLAGRYYSPQVEFELIMSKEQCAFFKQQLRTLTVKFSISIADGRTVRHIERPLFHRILPSQMDFRPPTCLFSIPLDQLHDPDHTEISINELKFRFRQNNSGITLPVNIHLPCDFHGPFKEEKFRLELELNENSKPHGTKQKKSNNPQDQSALKCFELDHLTELYKQKVSIEGVSIDIHDMLIRSLFLLLKFFLELNSDPNLHIEPLIKQYFRKFIFNNTQQNKSQSPSQSLFIETDNLIGELLGN